MTDNVTLLLVDDLEANLVAMAALLSGPGLRVLKARSGEEALELLLAHEVALALVDVQMPGMDGFELAEMMRGSERTKHVPIVFVTAGAHDRKRMFRGYDSGAVDFLYKPVEPHILTNKVNVFVELFRQKQALAHVSALQSAIFNSANFSSIATDAKGVIQIFNVGAERMLGYTAAEVMNRITPADISDPQEVIARAQALSAELATPITPGFEALVFKASRGIEDIYELTYIRKDGSRFPAVVSVTALRDAQEAIIGYLLIGTDNTARKQADQLQSRLGAIVSSADDGIMSKALDGVVTTWNASAERLFGYTAAEIIGNPNLHLTPPDLLHEEEHILEQILTGKAVKHFETQRMTKDGRRLMVSLTISPIKDATGNVIGASKIVRDITERKKAEEALRASEERLASVLEHLPVGVGLSDREGRMVLTNTSMRRFIGESVPSLDLQRRHRWRACAADGSQLEFSQWPGQRALRGETVLPGVEFRFTEDDGREIWVTVAATPLRGTSVAVVMVEDIDQRKHAEVALRASEERFRVAALAVSNLIWTNNAQGMMEGEQPGWGQFTGQTREEYQGHGWARAVHPDDAQPTIDAWNAAVAEKRLFKFEHRVRRHDGAWRSCSIQAMPVIGGDGEVREWVGVHNDITERKRSSAALIEAKERAEAVSKAKDNFLAALSHELRTPLTPVLMAATALASDPTLPAEAREQLDMMRRNIELEARLIDDLLDLTTISSGKLTLAPVAADIHELLHHTDEIIRSDGLGKRLRITLKLDAARHHALADPARLQQVFWNLLRNAVKFTPDGGGITVSTRNDAAGRIIISVADDGIGIRAEVLPQIFNAFEQGAIAGQHRFGGLGLGLAISQAIITAHDGEIRGESDGLNCGSTFTVVLRTVAAPTASATATEPRAVPPRTLKLLIVEDHEATRETLQLLLSLKGHQVTTAGSVQEALTIHGTERFDAVISDLGLPDGSGLELMRELQQQRPVPGIALSGYGMEGDLRLSHEAGFFAHLVKPVNVDQLRQIIDQIPLQNHD